MIVVWDEPKRLSNLRDHGLDFADARDGFGWEEAVILPSYPGTRGEERFMAVGFLNLELVTLVYSPLGSEALTFISLRRASVKERRIYHGR